MTNSIETTKREMYEALKNLKGRIEINYSLKDMLRGADEFEHALEDHLDALGSACAGHEALHQTARQRFEDIQALELKCSDLTNMNGILSDAYQQQKNLAQVACSEVNSLDEEVVGLKSELSRTVEERDALRNKLQAFEFANKSTADMLLEARRELSELRKSLTDAQLRDAKENAYREHRGAGVSMSRGAQAQIDGYRSGSIGNNGDSGFNPSCTPFQVED